MCFIYLHYLKFLQFCGYFLAVHLSLQEESAWVYTFLREIWSYAFPELFLSWNIFLSKLSKCCLFVFLKKFLQKLLCLCQLFQEFSDFSLSYNVFNRDPYIIVFLKFFVINLLLIARNGFLLMGAYLFKLSRNIFWNSRWSVSRTLRVS